MVWVTELSKNSSAKDLGKLALPAPPRLAEVSGIPLIHSRDLFKSSRRVVISHDEREYTLHITRRGV
jgi:hemin uptake protein HemP